MQEEHDWMDIERRSGTYQFGRKEGREEGREALLTLLFELLAERGLAADAQHEAQIRSCDDLTALRRWVRQAMYARSIDELFEPA